MVQQGAGATTLKKKIKFQQKQKGKGGMRSGKWVKKERRKTYEGALERRKKREGGSGTVQFADVN